MFPREWSDIPAWIAVGAPDAPAVMGAFPAATPGGGGDAGPAPQDGPPSELRRIFADWVDSESKVLLVRFFHDNPGVIETLEGLASRLGVSAKALEPDLEDHVRLGLLKAIPAGARKVYVYNRNMALELEHQVVRLIERAQEEHT